MDQEAHLMLFKICIHKIQLSVRFPCSLTFQLKIQSKSIDCRGTYQLTKGACTPEQTLRLQFQLQKREDQTYRDKQAKIIVYMTSANGKIPAGSTTISLASLKAGSSDVRTSAIEKCPDKSATISYTFSLDFLRAVSKTNSNFKSSMISVKQDSSVGSSSRIRFSGSPQVQAFRSGDKYDKYKSSVDRKNSNHVASYQTLIKNVAERDMQYDQKKGSRLSSLVDEIEMENKIVNLEKQRSEHIKQMSKLQREISRKNLQQKTQAEDHYNRIKTQLNEVIAQNDSLKQKIKIIERREKQQNQTIKQLRDEIERKKQKTYQQQFVRMESQSILEEKEKLIKEMQMQLKQCEEDINDLKMNLNTQQKRVQFKQAGFKDQLTKLNEKYQQSQLERQKAVIELNSMLEELEASQKKHQLTIKEKDKIYAEEKNKLVKKSQGFSRTIEQQKQQIDEKQIEISDLQRQIKILQGKLNEFQVQASQLKVEGKSTAYQLEKERQHNRELLKQLQKAQEIQNLYVDLKKKYQQLDQRDESNRKALEAGNKLNQQIQNRVKQFQQLIATKSQQISSLMTKIFTLNSQIEAMKRQQESSNRQAESLAQNNLNAANKIEELRMKLDQLQFTYNQLQSQSEQQIAYMIKTKQYLEAELEETKWNYEKLKDSNEQMSQKNKTLSNTILDFNRKMMEMQQKIGKAEQQLADAKSTIVVCNQDKQMQINKEKDLQEKLKQKNDQIFELNKRINKIEREHYMALEKLKHTETFYSEKLQSEEGLNKQKETKINEVIDSMNKLQIDLIAREESINTLQSTQSKMLMECEYLSQQLKISKKQNSQLEQALGHFKEEIISTTQKLNTTSQSLEKQISLKNQALQNLAKRSKQFEDFKSTNNAALEQLFLEIAKDLNPNSNVVQATLMSLPDEKLSALQVEAMKKRNNLIVKYQGQIRTMEINLKNMEDEISKTKKQHAERQEELEAMLESQKSKFKTVHSDLSLEKQELIQKISNMEDRLYEMTADSEKMCIEIDQNKIVIADQENYINQLNFEIENYKNEIKALQQVVKILKEQGVKLKNSFQNSLLSTSEENSVQIDKLKKLINQGQRKASALEKIIGEREQTISKLESGLENMTHQKQKVDQKITQLSSRFNQLTQQRKNGVENEKNYEKVVKKLEQKILGLESEIAQLSKKIDSYAIQKKKLQEALSQQQITKAKLFGQLQNAVQHSIQLENALKDTGDKSKKIGEKSSQQIKKLKQQIVGLNSTIELKQFEITQHQATIKSLKATTQQQSQQLQYKKQQVTNLQSRLEQTKNNNILALQELETALGEKASLENQVKSIKQAMLNLEQMLSENQSNLETLVLKDRQITKLKEEISNKDRNYQKTLSDLRGQFNQAKKQISARTQRQQQYKKKVRELESQIENNLYDAEAEKRGWEETAENQRKQLIYELEGVKDENKLLAQQFQFQREQMNHQLDQATEQISHLKQTISENQYHIESLSAQSNDQTERIKSLEFQLKNCKEEWQKQKLNYIPTQKQFKQLENQNGRYQKYALELQKKIKQLTQVAKKRLTEEQKSSCGDLLRQINTVILRNKSKIINRVGEREREQVLADFKQIHEKLESAIKSNLIYK